MQRRVVNLEVTPLANAEADDATKLVLLTALSQLRRKLCSEIAAVEELLGTAGSTCTDPLPVMAPLPPPLPASSSKTWRPPALDCVVEGHGDDCESQGCALRAVSGDSLQTMRKTPKGAVGSNLDSPSGPVTPGWRARTGSTSSGMSSDLQRRARRTQTDIYALFEPGSSDVQSVHFTRTEEGERTDERAEHARGATCSTDGAGSHAVGITKGFSGLSVGPSRDVSGSRVCTVLTSNDRAARGRADVTARRKRSVIEASLHESVQSRSMIRHRCHFFTHSKPFEAWSAVMILMNSAVLAAEVEFSSHNIGAPQPLGFRIAAYVFNFMFLFELACRIVAEGFRGYYMSPATRFWAAIDTFVVVTAALETAQQVLDARTNSAPGGPGVNPSNVKILKIMKIVRVLRSFRAFRLIRIMTNLQTLVVSILATLKAIVWAGLLIVFVVYVFSVVFTDCACDGFEYSDDLVYSHFLTEYWGSLDTSMASLFQAIANGVSWRDSYKALNEVSMLCGWIYLGFIIFTYFVLLNVITGVFCNAAIELARRNTDIVVQNIRADVAHVKKLFKELDTTGSGSITIEELEALVNDELARAQFCALGLDIRDAWTIFKLMDSDKNGLISESEFVSGIEALKGGAKNIDLAALRTEVRIANRKVLQKLEAVTRSDLIASSGLPPVPRQEEVEA